MKIQISSCIAIFLLSVFTINAQTRRLDKANKKYNQFEFIDATDIYLKVANSGYQSVELFTRLSNGLYFNARYAEALQWYKALYKLKDGNIDSQYLLRYSQALRAVGKNKKAEKIYNEFLESLAIKNDEFLTASDYLEIIKKSSNRYMIEKLAINSKNIDFGTFFKNDTLYFSSTRNNRNMVKRVDTWTNQAFLDVYYSVFDVKTYTYSEPEQLIGTINTKYHESTPVITKDGNTMYFTRSSEVDKKDKNAHAQLKIYSAKKVNGKWENAKELSINSDTYSNAHPVLSPDEKTLYFVSNRPSAIGQTDIFSAKIFNNGSIGVPENLGAKVNTKGRESFPFITDEGELYFSSDGHFGLGGYDVFYIDISSKNQQLLNVGSPVNSRKDDYAFSIDGNTKTGFFSSNRKKVDNIYSHLETKPIQDLLKKLIQGLVTDKATQVPLENSLVSIYNKENTLIDSLRTDLEGKFSVELPNSDDYIVMAEKEEYNPEDIFVSKYDEDEIHLELTKNIEKIEEGIDLSKILNIVIYFDFDKSNIREDAKVELEKIIAVLQEHPEIKLDLKAHTDSKGRDTYNLKLSDRRAKSSMEYLVKRGIDPSRLTAKGYGETELVNECANGVRCSKEKHQENRRTEFLIRK